MKLVAVTSNHAGLLVRPAARALSLLVVAALQMPCWSATPQKTYSGNCVDCHDRNLKGVVATHAPDSGGRAALYSRDDVDAGPNEILILAGAVSLGAVAGLFLLGFFGAREQIRSAD